jgi:hypothetical protein
MYCDSSDAADEQSEPLIFNAVTDSLQLSGRESVCEYRDYRQRWYMLAVVALLNLSNGLVFIPTHYFGYVG